VIAAGAGTAVGLRGGRTHHSPAVGQTPVALPTAASPSVLPSPVTSPSAAAPLPQWTPRLAIFTSGPAAHPLVNVRARVSQSRCLRPAIDLQKRRGNGWRTVNRAHLGSGGGVALAAPSSGTFRWQLPGSTLAVGRCRSATSPTAAVQIRHPAKKVTPPVSVASTPVTTVSSPPVQHNPPPPPNNPRTNAPVPPGG
jgi:hypothetical protein